MTKKTVKPPIVSQSLGASSSGSLGPHCDDIVEASMEERPEEALEDALGDDDEQWMRTVMSSLETRSARVREALKKALVHGEQAEATESHVQYPLTRSSRLFPPYSR